MIVLRSLEHFIGLPWQTGGRDFNGVDCVGLVALAARELFGLDWAELEVSFVYDDAEGDLKRLEKIADAVAEPRSGDVLVFRFRGALHTGIFVEGGRVLYIVYGGKSRTTRYHRWFQEHAVAFYRRRGDA